MSEIKRRNLQPQVVWDQVRKAWEDGETARVLAKRYGVGVPALWKRREAEGWSRPDPAAGPVEPAVGWDRHAQDEMAKFEARLEAERELALDLFGAMRVDGIDGASLWHVSFIYDWRAKNVGPEAAAGDRERARAHNLAWADAFWDEEGRLRPLHVLDDEMRRLNRDQWRRSAGLPDGVAQSWPCPAPPAVEGAAEGDGA